MEFVANCRGAVARQRPADADAARQDGSDQAQDQVQFRGAAGIRIEPAGRDTLPVWLSGGKVSGGRVEQNDLAVFGEKNIGREGFVSIGGAQYRRDSGRVVGGGRWDADLSKGAVAMLSELAGDRAKVDFVRERAAADGVKVPR